MNSRLADKSSTPTLDSMKFCLDAASSAQELPGFAQDAASQRRSERQNLSREDVTRLIILVG